MEIGLERAAAAAIETEALVVLGFLEHVPEPVRDLGEFSGKALETTLVHRPAGFLAKRLFAIGGGRLSEFTSADLRKAADTAVRALKAKAVTRIALSLDPGYGSAEFVAAAVEGAILGAFEPDLHKTQKGDKPPVASFTIVTASEDAEAGIARGRILGEAQNLTRTLVNEPANLLPPMALAARAEAMARAQGLECEVLDQDRMKQLGMGSLLGVAMGSAEPPALIVIRYRPADPAASNGAHLGLVGKGVTFDTGGVSIKPAEGMEKMKYDMAGGAAMIGAMQAIAQLKPSIPVTALIPAVENMCGSRAQRPGDIVTSLSGKTIEVLNTDAEGRLILADAMTYARRLGCTHLVDAATLTGAIVVALGHVNVGVFANDDALLTKLLAAAKAEGEKMWHMPLDEEYKDQLKSAFADLPNIGTRWGGAVTAAMFLKQFADDTPWVHLDIAGTAWLDEEKPHLAKGPSGVGVRTFAYLAANW